MDEDAGAIAHLLASIGDELKKKPEYAVSIIQKRITSAKAMSTLRQVLTGVSEEFGRKRSAEKATGKEKKVSESFLQAIFANFVFT